MKKCISKQFLSFVIAAILCCSLNAFALTDGDWEFQLLDNEAIITGYIGKGGDVVIPETIYGVPVTEIKGKNMLDSATSITFPSTIKTIYPVAQGSKNLKKLVIPNGIEKIEPKAFSGCVNLENVVFPESLQEIGYTAFGGCSNLTKIDLPSNLKSIESWTFQNTSISGKLVLPDSLEVLGDYAFSNTNITEVYIPYISNRFSYGAFSNCKLLKKAIIAPMNTYIPGGTFCGCTSLKYIDIPNTVTDIGYIPIDAGCLEGSFEGCTSLENIILPTSLKSINCNILKGCVNIKEVIIPYGTESIGQRGPWNNEVR